MKKLAILTLAILFLSPLVVSASPFLVYDPQPGEPSVPGYVSKYEVDLDGATLPSTPQDLGDGTVRVYFDLAGIPDGSHSVKVRAGNVWGWSEWTSPFLFTKELPASPTGGALEP